MKMENKEEVIINGTIYVPKGSDVRTIAKPNKKGLQYCVIRTYSAGVWAGWIDTKCKDTAQEVYCARRLWRFWSEFTLSALAVEGMKEGKEKENKYAMLVEKVILTQIIEIIPCTEKAMNQIINHPNYKQ